MWMGSILYEPIQQTYLLQYFNFPKITIFDTELNSVKSLDLNSLTYRDPISVNMPHVEPFKFRVNSFANNYNIDLILQFLPLLVVIVCLIMRTVIKFKMERMIL